MRNSYLVCSERGRCVYFVVLYFSMEEFNVFDFVYISGKALISKCSVQ